MGMPVQLIIGEKNIINNNIEVKDRKSGEVTLVSKDQIELFLKKNMNFNLESFIALRYLKSKRDERFVSISSFFLL